MLTIEEIDALTGDDIAYWLNNQFMDADAIGEKVRWWVTTAYEAGKVAGNL